MMGEKVAVLTSQESWFVPTSKRFVTSLQKEGYDARLFSVYSDIPDNFELVFILSYFKIIPLHELQKHALNLVVHESDLPAGKGWSPLFWQILAGKKVIPIVLFEAVEQMDAGKIYGKDFIRLEGNELYADIRKKQAMATVKLCHTFLKQRDTIKPRQQKGKESFYKKRTPRDSELNIQKSLLSQFNLLRIVDNKLFPAFFIHQGQKYIVKITKDSTYESENRK